MRIGSCNAAVLAAGCLVVLACPLHGGAARAGEYLPWGEYVRTSLDTLCRFGTDRYGPVRTGMLMSILDVETLESPQQPLWLDTAAYYEQDRAHRRAMAGSNLWYDQATLRTLYAVSQATGDATYAAAADASIRDTFRLAVKPNGLPVWGTHIFYNAFTDRADGDAAGKGPHEILVYHAEWPELYRVAPAETKRAVNAIWEWHVVDPRTGQHNRHDDKHVGCDFAFSGGSLALANAGLYRATGERQYLDRARTIAGWHWRNRHPVTGLMPDAPSTGDRYDAKHSFTTLPGPFAAYLLKCYEWTADKWFLDVALDTLQTYHKYGHDKAADTYFAMVQLDGSPVPDRERGAGYDAWAPYGHVDPWKTTFYSYEFPLIAAQSSVYACRIVKSETGQTPPELLEIATAWARVIERELPPKLGRRWGREIAAAMPGADVKGGSYAEDYGRSISFFVQFHHLTGDVKYRDLACRVARDAVDKLWAGRLFRAHSAKPYYEATQGVGLLLHAFWELEQLPQPWQPAL